jgi:hypothetical protein
MTDTRTTSSVLKTYPTAAEGVSVTSGGGGIAWSYGAWTEIVPSLAADTHIAGVTAWSSSFSDVVFEFELGVGAVGVETMLHRWRVYGANSANIIGNLYLFPVPIGVFPSGSRVSVRLRNSASSSVTFSVSIQFFENYDGLHSADEGEPMSGTQTASALVSVTPSSSAWVDSAWVELTPSIANEIAILGITATSPVACDCEWDLGTGGSGSEVVLTTIRTAPKNINSSVPMSHLWLPAPCPISASTRVAIRMRKSDTSTTAHRASLVYHDTTALL